MGSIFYRNGSRLRLGVPQQGVDHTFHPFPDLFQHLFYPIHPICLARFYEGSLFDGLL
jgi:hypothetical protein